MYYFLTASKDATIFQQQPTQNTGLDEILEVSKIYYGSLKDVARSLVKFDTNTLSQSLVDGDVTMSVAELVMRETEPSEIALDYSLEDVNTTSETFAQDIGPSYFHEQGKVISINYLIQKIYY